MTRLVLFPVIAVLLCASGSQAAEREGSGLRWLRRATLAASCGAGIGFDTWAMHHAVAQGVRVSGMYATSQGRPRYGLMMGSSAASCGLSAFLQERRTWSKGTQWIWITENAASLGIASWTGVHLIDVANGARTQPGTLVAGH